MKPDWIAPNRTAFVLIDCQVDFGSSDGAMARRGMDMTAPQAAVARCESLAAAARAAGVEVVFVRLITTDATRKQGEPVVCAAGTRGADFIGPQPLSGETIVSKTRFSAFAHTGLDEQICARNVDTLLLAGLTTECCVASSAWDAFERDFHVVIASDACAAYEEGLHRHTLRVLEMNGARLASVDDCITAWKIYVN